MDDGTFRFIESKSLEFQKIITDALSVTMQPWADYDSSRMRSEGKASEMVWFANQATDIEEKLAAIMILYNNISMLWDEIESEYLQRASMHPSQKYASGKGKIADAISSNKNLYYAKCSLESAVDIGKRAVHRLSLNHDIASRAAGLAIGG